MTLNEKLTSIQTRLKAKKSRYNSFGKYYFRSAEDLLESVKPYLLELGVSVTVSESIIAAEPFPIVESKATVTDGESAIHATAVVGVDLDQKGMQMPQKFGSASSYGKKYALGNLFLIDDTQDSDAGNSHGKAAKPKAKITSSSDAAFTKAMEYVKGGGKLDAIKAKYDLSPDVEKLLTTL